MSLDRDPQRSPGTNPVSGTAGFVTVLVALGTITHFLGVEAGLLAFVLAVVALVVSPRLYLSHRDDGNDEPDAEDEDPDPNSRSGT